MPTAARVARVAHQALPPLALPQQAPQVARVALAVKRVQPLHCPRLRAAARAVPVVQVQGQAIRARVAQVAQAQEAVRALVPPLALQRAAVVAAVVAQMAGLLVAHLQAAQVHQTARQAWGSVVAVQAPAVMAVTRVFRPLLAVAVAAQRAQAIQATGEAVEAPRALIRQRQPQARQTLQAMRSAFLVIF